MLTFAFREEAVRQNVVFDCSAESRNGMTPVNDAEYSGCLPTSRMYRGTIQNIPDWCRHVYSSCGSAKHLYMAGLPCPVSQRAKLHVGGWLWAVFTRVYLESCRWSVAIFTMDQTKEQRVCIKFCASLGKSATETHTTIQQAFGDKSLSCTQVFQWHTRFKTGRTSVDDDGHRETHKMHNSWNSCTNSTARPSLSTSDHSRHCWGGGSWLWDMPTGSDGRIGHASCRSEICAQDPDSWPEAAARQRLHWTSSARLRRWNVLV